MRQVDENRAENYIKKHRGYRKWLAFALIIALLTGNGTLYLMNKPATAVTQEGAESVGLMLETADAEFEQELISQMEASKNEAPEALSESEDAYENEIPAEESEEAEDVKEPAAPGNDTGTEEVTEKTEEAVEAVEDEEAEDKDDDTEHTDIEVPDSVDVADYVSATIIERRLEDGSWEVVEKEDIEEGDFIRVTFNYSIPEEAKLSEDIHFEIPEEFSKLDAQKVSLKGGDAVAEVTSGNQIKIEYSDDVKKDILEDTADDQASAKAGDKLEDFFKLFSITALAADTESLTIEGQYGNAKSPTDDRTSNMVVDSAIVYKTEYYWQDGGLVLKPVEQLEQVHDGDVIPADQELYLKLGFHIDPFTLSSSNNVFTYDLKKAGFTSVTPEQGRLLTDKNGVIIGTYDISGDGLVTFHPNEKTVNENASGEEKYGDLEFFTKVDSSQSDDNNKIEYIFNDKVKIYVYIQNKQKYNAYVNKSVSSYDESTGRISYKIIISTGENGTGGPINFTDVMKVMGADGFTTDNNLTSLINAWQYGDLKVVYNGVRYNGDWDITPYLSINRNGQTVSINNLDALEQGSTYTITYSYEVPSAIRGSLKAFLNNAAEIEVENIETQPSNITHEFNNIPKIDKEGNKNGEDITWTITLNSNHANLKGYVLTDYFKTIGQDGAEQHSYWTEQVEVTAYDENGNSYKIEPHEFQFTDLGNGEYGHRFTDDDTRMYVITYRSKPNPLDVYWNNDIVNHAEIKLETDDSIKQWDEASYHLDVNVMEKEAESVTQNESFVSVKWKVTFHAKLTPNQTDSNGQKYWYYKDTIDTTSVNHIITEQQKTAIIANLKSALGIHNDSEMTVTFTGAGTNVGGMTGYTGFEVKVYKNLDSDATVEYETTGYIGDGSSPVTFKNSGYVFTDHFGDSDEIKYYPTLSKMDGSGDAFGQTEDSTHQYYSQALLEKGIMQWIICVSIPSGYNDGELQLIEKLPKNASVIGESINYGGKTYYGLEIASDIGMSQNNTELVSGTSFMGTNFAVAKNSEGNRVTIDFDGNALAGKTFFLRICASIDDEFWQEGQITEGTFINEVTLSKKSGGEIATEHQTQTIEKTESLIEKTGERYEVDTEAVDSYKYVLDINEGGADLLEESDTLTLIDTLHTYSAIPETGSVNVNFSVSLDPDYLKVYEVDADGVRTELDKSQYSYMLDDYYTDEYTYSQNNYKVNHYSVIEFKIPDGKHLQIEYVYKFFGSKGTTIYLDNEAVLKGIAENNSSHHYEDGFKIQNDSAHLWSEAVKIVKVDDTNIEKVLSGVTFKLYKYTVTGNEGAYVPVSDQAYDVKTDEDGTIIMNRVIAYNTAYKLVEVDAPDGYIAKNAETYFIVDSGSENISDVKPDDFEKMGGKRYASGSTIFVRNTPNKTSITINKIWDEEGSDSHNRPGVINVKIGRSLIPMDEEHEVVESYNVVNILRKDQNGVIKQFIGLPSVKNGSTVSFTIGGKKGSWTSVPDVEVNGSKMDVASLFGYSESGQTVTVSLKITGNTDIVITDTWNFAVETAYSIQEPVTTATTPTAQITIPVVEDKDYPKTVQLEGSKDSSSWTKTLDNLEKYYIHTDRKVYKWVYYIESEEVNAFYFYEADSARKNSGTLTITNHRNTVEGYELPKTGGAGVIPYALIGLGLSGSAVIGNETVRRRKKEEETKE